MSDNRSETSGVLIMLAACVLFAIMAGLVGLAGQTVSPFSTAFVRFGLGLVLLSAGAATGLFPLKFRRKGLLTVRGLLGATAVFVLYMTIPKIGLGRASVLNTSFPIFAAIGGAVFLGERVRPVTWSAILVSFAGVYLIGSAKMEGGVGFGLYEALAVGGAVCAGGAVVTVRKLRETDASNSIYFAHCLCGVLMTGGPGAMRLGGLAAGVWLVLAGVAVSGSAGQLLMTYAYKRVRVATGSLMMLLVPVISVFTGVLAFDERLDLQTSIGIVLVIASCAFVVLAGRRARPPAA